MQNGFASVELGPLDQIVDPFFDPFVALAIVFELRRYVVAQVVSLVLPDADHVGLEQSDLVECRAESVKELLLLVMVCLHPQHGRCDPPHPQGGKFHALAGWIEFPEIGLADRVTTAQFRNLSRTLRRWLAQVKQGEEQCHHREDVDDLSTQRTIVHAAISRVLRKK